MYRNDQGKHRKHLCINQVCPINRIFIVIAVRTCAINKWLKAAWHAMSKKNHFVYMRHACTLSMPTFSIRRSPGYKGQSAVSYPDKINGHQFGSDCKVMLTEGGEKSDENVVNEDPVMKRNSTSATWTYFGFRRDNVLQTQVLCRTCWAALATSRGNTTNIHQHLQYNHEDLHEQFKTNVSHH